MITIRKFEDGNVRAVIQPNDAVDQSKEILGGDTVSLVFSLPYHLVFSIGDYASILGDTYYLTTRPVTEKAGRRDYRYTLNMEGEQHKLGRVQYQKQNGIGQFLDSHFFINSTADTFLKLLVDNMNRVFPDEGWKAGYVVDNGVRNIQFDGVNCLEAIATIADAFETEWLVEGRTIHLYRKQNATGLVFRRGENEALYSITSQPQNNGNRVTRLYAYGSNRNLPANYRNGATRLRLGALTYVEKYTDEFGTSWEDSQTFDDIFPRRVGEVTAVDNSNPLVFTDGAVDFNVTAHLVDGVTAKVVFESGQLTGYEFELSAYNHAAKTFTIKKNNSELALDIPSESIRPAVGDKYILIDLRMPEVDVLKAENELRQRAISWLDELYINSTTFSVTCNPLYFKRNGITLKLADSVTLIDEEMGIVESIRVVKMTRNLRRPELYTVELAKKAKENVIVKLLSTL